MNTLVSNGPAAKEEAPADQVFAADNCLPVDSRFVQWDRALPSRSRRSLLVKQIVKSL
jgi:hypothetical protein